MSKVIPVRPGCATLENVSILTVIPRLRWVYKGDTGHEAEYLVIGGNPLEKLLHELRQRGTYLTANEIKEIFGLKVVRVRRDACEVGE